ncbi:hypothetical protein [Streptomyces gardneri]|uniref:hypothetical protein n=1 Tax=Streptomyces gardneri TaxID=66892 RepID=UPI0036C36F0A
MMTHLLCSPSRSGRCLTAGVLGAAALALGLLTALPASAADGELSITGPESAKVELDDHGKRDHLHGPLPLVISNTSPTRLTPVLAAYLDATGGEHDEVCTRTGAVTVAETGRVRALGGNEARAVVVDLVVPEQCVGREGTLVVSAPNTPPATTRFTLTRGAEHEPKYTAALLTAAVLALLVCLLMAVPATFFGKPRDDWERAPLDIDSPWSVKDSWLTNITALGAVVGTILSTTGFLTDWLPGVDLGRFLGMNLLFGGLILFAPIIYSASCYWGWPEQKDEKGKVTRSFKPVAHGWGLVVAAYATLFGVFGQLATIVVLVVSAAADQWTKWALYVLVAVAAFFVGLYSLRFVRGALAAPPADGVTATTGQRSAVL